MRPLYLKIKYYVYIYTESFDSLFYIYGIMNNISLENHDC